MATNPNISVVPIGKKVCKPFALEVMVFSPEKGFKFEVMVERSCTPAADPIWKLVFDLYQQKDDKMAQVVHVSYTAKTPVESQAIQQMADQGIQIPQANAMSTAVFPAAKKVVGKKQVPKKDSDALLESMSGVLSISG